MQTLLIGRFGLNRSSTLLLFSAVCLTAVLVVDSAMAQTMNVALDIMTESGLDNVDGSRVRVRGSSTGDLTGGGAIQTIPLSAQGAGANRGDEGFFESSSQFGMQLTFDVPNAKVTHIRFTSQSPTGSQVLLDNRTTGDWLPGTWDPSLFNDSQFDPNGNLIDPNAAPLGNYQARQSGDPNQQAADYGGKLITLLNYAIRDINTAVTSDQLAVTGGTFNGKVGLELVSGTLDLDAFGTGSAPIPLSAGVQAEIDPNAMQPSGGNYPGNIVWREVTGIDGFGNPIFGPLADAFSDDALWYQGGITGGDIGRSAAVLEFDANGNTKPQIFENLSTVSSNFTDTLSGTNDELIELDLEIDLDATAAFFLGNIVTEFSYFGDFDATFAGSSNPFDTGNGLFASATIKVPGDGNGDGSVDIGDFTLWGGAFTTQDPNGDFNGDGNVDIGDFTQWGSFFGWGSALPGPAPEPSSAILLAAGGVALASASRYRRRRRC